jgi:hypothetical protein
VPTDRNGQVGLQRPRLDLLEDPGPQVGEVGGPRFGVGVLGLEVGAHLGRILLPQPLVVVDPDPAVVVAGGRAAFG